MKKVLVIDDTPELLQSIAFALGMENYDVLAFGNPMDAIQALTLNTIPDLIITDLAMAPMDGFQFIEEIRKRESLRAVPIVIFSARPMVENYIRAIELGVHHYVSKPVTIEALLAKVETILNATYGA
jgi:DNA-binding response OmpR family regulator